MAGCGGGGETVTTTSAVESSSGDDYNSSTHTSATGSQTPTIAGSTDSTTEATDQHPSEVTVSVDTPAETSDPEQITEESPVVVIRSNTAPLITGTPDAIAFEGTEYQFIPSALDEDNDYLAFEVKNKPAWMVFDAITGTLSGTPSKDDVGDYPAITISVSDGQAVTSLESFYLTVKSTSATLSWAAPATRSDGSSLPISEIAGYKIYVGTSASDLSLATEITDPYVMEHEFSNLSEGTYYFAVSTYDQDDMESELSTVVSKSI